MTRMRLSRSSDIKADRSLPLASLPGTLSSLWPTIWALNAVLDHIYQASKDWFSHFPEIRSIVLETITSMPWAHYYLVQQVVRETLILDGLGPMADWQP